MKTGIEAVMNNKIKEILFRKKILENKNLPTSERVNQYWGNFFNKRQQKEDNKDKVLWLDSPIIKEYASNEYMNSKDDFSYWKEKYFPENGFKRGLELGCGSGLPSLVYSTVVQSLDAYDVSEEAVNLAKKMPLREGLQI